MELPEIRRRRSRPVDVGGVTLGGDAPVRLQSMTNTPTADAAATLDQVRRLAEAGAELVRVAVPTAADTAALADIVAGSPVPIIADVHFHFDRAIEAIAAGASKIRLNPGNIADRTHVREVLAAAAERGVAIRVGVNEGSIVERRDGDRRQADLARPLVELMLDKMARYLEVFADADFTDLVLSAKSPDAVTTIAVNRALAKRYDWPLHLGVTHAGTAQTGAIRSAAALGALLAEGIGETIRISYAGDPIEEVLAGRELLASLRLRRRRGLELIACPTCGRLQMDIAPIVAEVQRSLADVESPVKVAVMGCVVNGPGEAEGADLAICAGRDKAILYVRGQRQAVLAVDEIIPALREQIAKLTGEGAGPA